MTRICLALAGFLIISSAGAEPLILASKYKATGTNPDGSAYKWTAAVEIIPDTAFAIEWSIGGNTYKGFGMRRNDALAATYMMDGEPGLIAYRLQGNGFDGLWAIRGEDGNGTEHLTPSN